MAEHFPTGRMLHKPLEWVPDRLHHAAEANYVLACIDVILRDKQTGRIFLAHRRFEPNPRPSFIGGRRTYNTGFRENATKKLTEDLNLHLPPARFNQVATNSTPYNVAGPGREDHGRHTDNTVVLADLMPEEVDELNRLLSEGAMSEEYSGGGWVEPKEIVEPGSTYPDVIKQLVRNLYMYDTMMEAIEDDAHKENATLKSL